MAIESDFWAGRRVLLTGHTGFKGAWLALWLQSLGAEVTGLSRSPGGSLLYERARIAEHTEEHRGDVRDAAAVGAALARSRAELVVHLAGQPFVRRSLRDPVATYEVNVIGTLSVLDAVRLAPGSVRGVLVVTSDKCYENPPRLRPRLPRGRPARRQRPLLELEGRRGAARLGLPALLLRRRGCAERGERASGQRDRRRRPR